VNPEGAAMTLTARHYSYFSERGRWFFRTHDGVMGPFHDEREAQMAVLYFQQRLKWPNARQLHEFMDVAPARVAARA
jgi:hypothetical protein